MVKFILTVVLALSSAAAMAEYQPMKNGGGKPTSEEFKPYGEGLPLPWPFPWAKDCPVKWSSISGRYLLSDSESGQEVDLKVSIVTQRGFRFMRISRYSRAGEMLSDGFTLVSIDQRSVHINLRPLTPDGFPIHASLKMHYETSDFSCEMNRLVPILALTEKKPNEINEIQYRLIRRPQR